MKKIILPALLIFSLSPVLHARGGEFTLRINGNYFSLADTDFTEKFGEPQVFTEGQFTLTFSGNLYLWGSFGLSPRSSYEWTGHSNKGVIDPDLQGETISDRRILSFGLGYHAGFYDDIAVKIEIGACKISDAQKTTITGISTGDLVSLEDQTLSGIGVRGNLGILYGLYKNLFSEFSVGYLYAADKVGDEWIYLGGLRFSLGLGYKF